MYAENLMMGMVSAIVPAGTCDISAFFETKSLCSSKARGFFFCVHLLFRESILLHEMKSNATT